MLRERLRSREFALAEFGIVAISGAALCLYPSLGGWALVIALLPWGFKVAAGVAPFQRTRLDWLVAVFVLTALAGWWVSYDKTIAGNKLLLILASVLLFYSLSAQPKENLVWVSTAMFCVGVGVSVYFFLTHDFIANPRKLEVVNIIGSRIMEVRPLVGWVSIHPNYVSGIAAVATPFIFYPLWKVSQVPNRNIALLVVSAAGLGVILFSLFMTTSRGVLLAIASAAGVWFSWRILDLNGIRLWLAREAVLPSVVLICLAAVVLVLFAGPAQIGGDISSQSNFGTGSRAELFGRSMYLVSDFPFTGGGLGSFPALYSHYMLGIPYYNVPNSHNLFLDVFIEQGIFGGVVFLSLYVALILLVARGISKAKLPEMKVFGWVALTAFVIALVHGMVDDYLYHEKGTILSLVLPGISISFMRAETLLNERWFPLQLPKNFILATSALLLGVCLFNWDRIQSAWFANMGAVKMAQVELAGFPTGAWATADLATKLGSADASLHAALEADPANQTANHRLGMIAMLRRDFPSAVGFLETAHAQAPRHRGIVKALGFSYVWLGDLDSAQSLLVNIPETKHELDAYVWWWTGQGQFDFAERASAMQTALKNQATQP